MNSREYIIIRECAKWWNSDKECYRGRYPRDSYQYVCECKNTGCNRSTRFSSKTIIFLYILCQIIIFIVGNPTWHKCIFENRLETFNWLSWRHSYQDILAIILLTSSIKKKTQLLIHLRYKFNKSERFFV